MTTLYHLGPFRLDPAAGVLMRDGVPVALGARAVAVLAALVARAGEFIGKADIMEIAWPGVIVEEGNLAVQITMLRRALAQAPGGAGWIETLAKRGYRFAGPVTAVETAFIEDTADGGKASNLPASLTSFIGREEELARIRLLLPGARLLTLVGIGGIGKTRLALHAARELADTFRDGVWFVDLAPLTDPALVASAVAQVLGVQEASGKPPTDALARQLKSSELLLILDNCEHLLEACAKLAEALLGACKEVTILATSREPLQVPGEQTWLIPALSLPDPAAGEEVIAQSEAVQLFVGRAQLHRSGTLLASRLVAVAKLCIRLDGIPLALELAAARTRSLTVEDILARLDDRFALLTGGARTALPRQQTLRATLDWSYDLLTEEERTVFKHLSIFHGSFTLDAAMAVASTDTIGPFAVTDLISQLVARSLVVVDTTSSGARYHLLETPRAYAREKLDAASVTATLERRHAQYFSDFFAHATEDWFSVPDKDWDNNYSTELKNVRAALRWAFGLNGDPAIGIELTGVSGSLWIALCLLVEGRQWLRIAIAEIGEHTSEIDQARLWHFQGWLWTRAKPAEALTAIEKAVRLYRRLGDGLTLGHLLLKMADNLALMGQLAQAESALAEALPLLEKAGLPKALATYWTTVGFLKLMSGKPANAQADYRKALILCRRSGAERNTMQLSCRLADAAWACGDLDAASCGFRENIEQLRKSAIPANDLLGLNLAYLAGVLTEQGKIDAALTAAREALSLLQDTGYAWRTTDHFALRAALASKLANAARLTGFTGAAYAAKNSPREPNEARALARLHTLLREKLAPDELTRLLAEGAKLSEEEACRLALEE